jgi:hypothetical protein
MWIKLETRRGYLGGINGTLRREGRGKCCGYSEVFYVLAPPVSVKDRWLDTCGQILNVHAGDMGPINLVACCR